MKRYIALLLALIFLLCACNTAQSNNSDTNVADPDIDNSNNGGAENDNDSSDDNQDQNTEKTDMTTAYKDIVCRTPDAYTSKYFLCKDSNYNIRIPLPSDWSLHRESNQKTAIKRDGIEIGWIRLGKDVGVKGWESVKHTQFDSSSLLAAYDIEYLTTSNEPKYRYRMTYTFDDTHGEQTITFAVNFDEICPALRHKMMTEWKKEKISSESNIGLLSDIDRSRPVAFIGNSFIWTSQVANIFSEMISSNGKSLAVDTFEYGGAQIYNFARNPELLKELESGKYGTVFLCGFYGKYTNEDLLTIIKACRQGNTRLVAFPAHNERQTSIDSARAYARGLTFLDWKAEIDMLIALGVNPLDMYVQDANNHSTPLAGYVGAHMVYRAIFGEIPTGTLVGEVKTSYARAKLGDYVRLGFTYPEGTANSIKLG